MLSPLSPLNRFIAAAVLFALAACGQQAETGGGEGAGLGAPLYAAPKHYEAISRTAEAITGGVEIAAAPRAGENAPPRVKITFGLGLVYEADWIETNRADADVAGEAWTATLPVPDDAEVSVYAVDAETIGGSAPNGGLCGPEKAQYLAVAEYRNAMGEDEMQMAAYSDTQWPPVGAPHLCGTFTYIAAE